MNRSPVTLRMRVAVLPALGVALLLTAGEALPQERFQSGFRAQGFGNLGNRPFVGQRNTPRVDFRNGLGSRALRIAPLPQSSPAGGGRKAGGSKSVQFAPLPQTGPARNPGNGGGSQTAKFVPLPQTPPGRNGGEVGGSKTAQFVPLPQTGPARNGGSQESGGRQSNPQFIVAPSAPPAGGNEQEAIATPPKSQVANLAPAAEDTVPPAKAVQAEAPVAAKGTGEAGTEAEAFATPRGIKDFVVKYEGTFYHVRRTVENEYKVLGFVDEQYKYHVYVRPSLAPAKPRRAPRRKVYSYGYIHAPFYGYGAY